MTQEQKVLVLGASGSVGEETVPVLLAETRASLTLVARQVDGLKRFEGNRVRLTKGDVLDPASLDAVMAGQDIVFASLSGRLEKMAENIVAAMKRHGVKRLIFISSMGIYGETGEDHGSILDPYRKSAAVVEASGLDYTVIRPGWFTAVPSVDYQLTRKGEPFRGHQVSRRSIADLVSKLVQNPAQHVGESLGIAQV